MVSSEIRALDTNVLIRERGKIKLGRAGELTVHVTREMVSTSGFS